MSNDVREKIVDLIDEYKNAKSEQETIHNELNHESQVRVDAQNQASQLDRQVQFVEVNLDATTAKVERLTKQLIEVLQVSEAAKQYIYILELIFVIFFSLIINLYRICNTLECQIRDVKDKETRFDTDLKQSKASTLETDKRFQEVEILVHRRIVIDFV